MKTFLSCLALSLLLSVGYAHDGNSSRYPSTVYGQAGSAWPGRVVSVRLVEVNRPASEAYMGAGVGGLIGGVVASQSSHRGCNSGRTALGMVLGGVVGAQMEHRLSRTYAEELLVRYDNGTVQSFVQAPSRMRVGQMVWIIQSCDGVRVCPQ